MSDMCAAALSGYFAFAEQLNSKLNGLHTALFIESNPIPVKYAVSKMGYTANKLRLPLTSLSSEFEDQVDDAMRQAS
jgi:4-hydroxy-tetrahydrodipicolinate synthase